ncbi:MAG: hypothetical protein LBC65_05695 [Oscillospiraceae bacterium]|jgi:flagellar biosynthesis/type III secretory pathway protein FliH|nr:hypothetical protein [Oscillospiraceae bacterium]
MNDANPVKTVILSGECAPEPEICTTGTDYAAVIEASEIKLDSLNAEIDAKQRQLEDLIRKSESESEQLVETAKQNASQIQARAREAGYADGKAAAELELRQQRELDATLVNLALREVADAKAEALASHETEVVNLCFDIVEKIFGTDFERGHEALIRQALKSVGAGELAELPSEAIFDYDGQTIDASFQTQLRKIRETTLV